MTIDTLALTAKGRIRPEWIDYNGHMNVAYYVLAFDQGTDRFLADMGLDADYLRAGGSTFALEMHVTYDRELHLDAPYEVRTQLVDADTKRLHLFHRMFHAEEGWLAATNEVITMHIDMATRRSAPFPAVIQDSVDRMLTAHAKIPRPDGLGRVIGIRRRSTEA
ncbi:MAG TPA: thioesterase family protein [Azoarcus taiwanensis]|uniref:Thioesterase-like protein n=1 Tax=Azoarcus taiwanensis TaxID=666964 RepID=A0A972J8V3_9RHOO|nr:thioesterase family protein [Azoarcus taiwanensis]NMG04134.1 thioesterase-like protein [Azoarcus taiwanensis]HRQ58978.1 thioesterase family protein [Azoarcus taiwanensis]